MYGYPQKASATDQFGVASIYINLARDQKPSKRNNQFLTWEFRKRIKSSIDKRQKDEEVKRNASIWKEPAPKFQIAPLAEQKVKKAKRAKTVISQRKIGQKFKFYSPNFPTELWVEANGMFGNVRSSKLIAKKASVKSMSQMSGSLKLLTPIKQVKGEEIVLTEKIEPFAFENDTHDLENIAAIAGVTPFIRIIDHVNDDIVNRVVPYIQKFDKLYNTIRSTVKGNISDAITHSFNRLGARFFTAIPSKLCAWSVNKYYNKSTAIQNTFYSTLYPPKDFLVKKSGVLHIIYLKQRLKTLNNNIVVINFEGVIGDFYKQNLLDQSYPGLYIRPDVRKALKQLQENHQLVLVWGYSQMRIMKILSWFNRENVNFSAVYRFSQPNPKLRRFWSYEKIYSDFKVKNTAVHKIIVISALNLATDDIYCREKDDLIAQKTGIRWDVFADRLPVTHNDYKALPWTVLIPNIRSWAPNEVMSLLPLVELLDNIQEISTSWSQAFTNWRNHDFDPSSQWSNKLHFAKLVNSTMIQELYLRMLKRQPKASELQLKTGDSIRLAQKVQTRKKKKIKSIEYDLWPLHKTILWENENSLLSNQIIILPVDAYLHSEMVGSVAVIEKEQYQLYQGVMNLLQYY